MTVRKLVSLLTLCPQDMQISMTYDGGFGADWLDGVWITDEEVILVTNRDDLQGDAWVGKNPKEVTFKNYVRELLGECFESDNESINDEIRKEIR